MTTTAETRTVLVHLNLTVTAPTDEDAVKVARRWVLDAFDEDDIADVEVL